MQKAVRGAIVPILLAVALVACNREKNAHDNRPAMNPVMPAQKDLPATQPAPPAQPQVNVELTEYEIRMPDALKAGNNSLRIANAGKENHSFVIEGPGLYSALPEPLTRGNSATLEVALEPGTYTITCPVDGHKGKGMTKTITVQK